MLNFNAGGITLTGATPSVVLLIGKNEERTEFTPSGDATKTFGTRTTPLGLVDEEHTLWQDPRGYAFTWTVGRFKHRSGLLLRARFYNGSAEPVRLQEFVLCRTRPFGVKVEGDPGTWLLTPLAHATRVGTLGEQLPSINDDIRKFHEGVGWPVPELSTDERMVDGRWRIYNDYTTLYTDKGKKGWAFGPVGEPAADLRFEFQVDNGSMTFVAASEMTNIVIEPGQARDAQDLLILAEPYETAVASMLEWAALTHGRRTHRGPVFGWCSWYDLYKNITAESVEATAEAAGRLKNQVPFQVIQIDDGYEDQPGDWRCGSKFPAGWTPIIQKIRAAGAIPGIWIAPLAVHESLAVFKDHPDWFQRDAQGQLLAASQTWGPTSYWLDSTHPEAKEFLRQIIRNAKAEGFSYFKIDFNNIQYNCRFHDTTKTRMQAYRDLYKLYREEIGESGYLLACSQFVRGVFGYADAARIGQDSCPIWRAKHPCTISECIRSVGMNAVANGIFFDNDPDVTYDRPRDTLTDVELQTWHGFVGLLGGMAMISEPLQSPEHSTPETLWRVEILNPPGPERGKSFHAATDREHTQFGFDSLRPWGNSASILLWNPADEPAARTLDAEELGALGDWFHVWSFWDQRYLGIGQNGFSTGLLPAHGSALLRLTAMPVNENLPVLVGSTLHISLGSAEIFDLAVTPEQIVIQLTDAGARAGKLFLYSKQPLSLKSAEGCSVKSITGSPDAIWTVSLGERNRNQKQTLRLRVE